VSNLFTWSGEVLIEYLVYFEDAHSCRGSMFCNISGGACFFFDIDVKEGEKSPGGEFECMWGIVLPSMPKGEIVGKYLTNNECLSLMASIAMKMA
jgi:hypothetical protein